jgi:HSP20 family protein
MSALVRWDPFNEMQGLRRAMDRVFEDFPSVRGWRVEPQELAFPIDLAESEDKVTVKASLAGLNPEDVDISVSDGVLTIKGETKSDETDEGKNYYRREIRYGAFSRSIPLPARVNHEQAEASFDNGILTVVLPKAEEVRPKQIKVTGIGTKTLEASAPSAN